MDERVSCILCSCTATDSGWYDNYALSVMNYEMTPLFTAGRPRGAPTLKTVSLQIQDDVKSSSCPS